MARALPRTKSGAARNESMAAFGYSLRGSSTRNVMSCHSSGACRRQHPSPPSHPENLGIARLDLLALRDHDGRVGFEQLDRRQRRSARLLLDERVHRAVREIVDEDLLRLGAEHEGLE